MPLITDYTLIHTHTRGHVYGHVTFCVCQVTSLLPVPFSHTDPLQSYFYDRQMLHQSGQDILSGVQVINEYLR